MSKLTTYNVLVRRLIDMEFNNQRFNNGFMHQVPPYPSPESTMVSKTNDDDRFSPEDAKQIKVEENGGADTFVNTVLRNTIGRRAQLYFSYPDSDKWRDIVYDGIIELIGEDYIIITDYETRKIQVLLMLYLEWVEYEVVPSDILPIWSTKNKK